MNIEWSKLSDAKYYRVGTTDGHGTSFWNEMHENNRVSVGWSDLEDLNIYKTEPNASIESIKTAMRPNFEELFPSTQSTMSRQLNQLIRFAYGMEQGDIVVAQNGYKVQGIGMITGDYAYEKNSLFPHTRAVQWLYIPKESIIIEQELRYATCTQYKNPRNILTIRQLLGDPTATSQLSKEKSTRSLNTILYGPPGTGKTYNTIDKAVELINGTFSNDHATNKERFDELRAQGQIEFVTFHQNYSYEDFMIGIKPDIENEHLRFKPFQGIFYEIVKKARENWENDEETLKNFVLVIDEINRANISKVFGELITLLEDDKRLGAENELIIALPNGEQNFAVPPNLYLIGTMNTADKSIALIDIALRRRFEFVAFYPRYDLEGLSQEAAQLLEQINKNIFENKKSADYLIGHAYFMKGEAIEITLENKVIPLLMEYFAGKTDIVEKIFEGTSWTAQYNVGKPFQWEISKGIQS